MKWNLNFTTSKLLSYLILLSGTAVAFYTKDNKPFIDAMLYATIVQGVKNVSADLAMSIKNKIIPKK